MANEDLRFNILHSLVDLWALTMRLGDEASRRKTLTVLKTSFHAFSLVARR